MKKVESSAPQPEIIEENKRQLSWDNKFETKHCFLVSEHLNYLTIKMEVTSDDSPLECIKWPHQD